MSERFWAKVQKTADCWIWTGGRGVQGYGQFFIRKLGKDRPLMARAHRVAWELLNGPIPPGVQLCHRCDNPPCVNPAHLFFGDWKTNAADRDAKGRLKTPLVPGHRIRRTYNGRAATR